MSQINAVVEESTLEYDDNPSSASRVADQIESTSRTKSVIDNARYIGQTTEKGHKLIRVSFLMPDDTSISIAIVITPNSFFPLVKTPSKPSTAKNQPAWNDLQKIRATHNSGKGFTYSPLRLRDIEKFAEKLNLPYTESRDGEIGENSANEYSVNMETLHNFINARFSIIVDMANNHAEKSIKPIVPINANLSIPIAL